LNIYAFVLNSPSVLFDYLGQLTWKVVKLSSSGDYFDQNYGGLLTTYELMIHGEAYDSHVFASATAVTKKFGLSLLQRRADATAYVFFECDEDGNISIASTPTPVPGVIDVDLGGLPGLPGKSVSISFWGSRALAFVSASIHNDGAYASAEYWSAAHASWTSLGLKKIPVKPYYIPWYFQGGESLISAPGFATYMCLCEDIQE
jgi:hypothetical protein